MVKKLFGNRKQFEQYTGDNLEFKKVNVEFHRGQLWAQNIFIYIYIY